MKTDIEIIAEVLGGNSNAYAELVRRHQSKIRVYCNGVFGAGPAADDAAQEVFIKAYQALGSFKEKSSFGTWLYRIAINHCRDLLRKKGRNRESSLERMRDEQGDAFDARLARPGDQAALGARELAEKILDGLSESSRTVIVLREVQELSYEEMMEVLGCSLDAVKSRLKRAREEIDKKFGHFLKQPVV
jgi:RNA polymerase sigma-70 factor (ECF subfamily)